MKSDPKNKALGLSLLQKIWLAPVFIYRIFISPLLGANCKYYPTCSSYMIESVRKHGIAKGTCLGICRILRCNGFYTGGYDPPPETFSFKQIRKTRRDFSIRLQKKR